MGRVPVVAVAVPVRQVVYQAPVKVVLEVLD
jgi:hypothetical protein